MLPWKKSCKGSLKWKSSGFWLSMSQHSRVFASIQGDEILLCYPNFAMIFVSDLVRNDLNNFNLFFCGASERRRQYHELDARKLFKQIEYENIIQTAAQGRDVSSF